MSASWGSLGWILDEAAKRKTLEPAALAPSSSQGVVQYVQQRRDPVAPARTYSSLQDQRTNRDQDEGRHSQQQQAAPVARVVDRELESLPTPPLPVYRPMVDPVVDLKQETAREYNFAPQATEELYQTPVHVYRIGEQPKPEYGKWSGLYWGSEDKPGGRIDVWSPPRDPSKSVVPTLAHEYGHKWYSENLSRNLRDQYLADIAGKQPAGFPMVFAREHPNEMYAEGVAAQGSPSYRGGYSVDASAMSRDPWLRYYPGLYNSPPASDLQRRGRRVKFEDGSWGWEYPDG